MTARVARPDCHRGTPWCELDTITIIDYCNYCPIPSNDSKYLKVVQGHVLEPGHHGIRDNETTDVLAKQALAQCYVGPEPVLGVTTTVCKAVRQWSTDCGVSKCPVLS